MSEALFGAPHKIARERKRAPGRCRIAPARVGEIERYAEIGRDGANWYEETPRRILDLFNKDRDRTSLFIALLAATSPLENIESNTRLALKALRLFDAEGANERLFARVFRFDAHFCNIMRAIWGEPLSGPKVTAFYQNLIGPQVFPEAPERVTVDRWMVRAAKGVCPSRNGAKDNAADDAPSKREYACIERLIRKLAHEAGIEPRQYQAAVWVGIKRECGSPLDIADPFEVALERQLNDRQTFFDFDAPEPPVAEAELEPDAFITADDWADAQEDPLGGFEELAGIDDPIGMREEREIGENPPLHDREGIREEILARMMGDAWESEDLE